MPTLRPMRTASRTVPFNRQTTVWLSFSLMTLFRMPDTRLTRRFSTSFRCRNYTKSQSSPQIPPAPYSTYRAQLHNSPPNHLQGLKPTCFSHADKLARVSPPIPVLKAEFQNTPRIFDLHAHKQKGSLFPAPPFRNSVPLVSSLRPSRP